MGNFDQKMTRPTILSVVCSLLVKAGDATIRYHP